MKSLKRIRYILLAVIKRQFAADLKTCSLYIVKCKHNLKSKCQSHFAYNGLQHGKWVECTREANLVFLERGNDSSSVMLTVVTESNR